MKKLFSTKYSATSFTLATLLLRLTCGGLMIPYGFNILIHFARMSQNFSDPFHIGHTPSLLLAVFAEFFCAFFVVIGLLTRLACIPLIIAMGVAFFLLTMGKYLERDRKPLYFLQAILLFY